MATSLLCETLQVLLLFLLTVQASLGRSQLDELAGQNHIFLLSLPSKPQMDSASLHKKIFNDTQALFRGIPNVIFMSMPTANLDYISVREEHALYYFPKKESDFSCLLAPPTNKYDLSLNKEKYQGNAAVTGSKDIPKEAGISSVPVRALDDFPSRKPLSKDCQLRRLISSLPGPFTLEDVVEFINEKCGTFLSSLPGTSTKIGRFMENRARIFLTPRHVENGPKQSECDRIDVSNVTAWSFFRDYVSKNTPVVIQNAAQNWSVLEKWNLQYFNEELGDQQIHVKISPDGNFEGTEPLLWWEQATSQHVPQSVLEQLESPDRVVVRPATMDIKFKEFLQLMQRKSSNTSFYIEYTSLRSLKEVLRRELPGFPFASFLAESTTNLWFGDGKTVGKLHFDPYENLLVMVSGSKKLLLFEPSESEHLYEGHVREAILEYDRENDKFHRRKLLESTSMVNSPVDLQSPDIAKYPLFRQASALSCDVQSGDALYLPAYWWHEVYSSPDVEGKNIAVNYWYEPVYTKPFPCRTCRLAFNKRYYRQVKSLVEGNAL